MNTATATQKRIANAEAQLTRALAAVTAAIEDIKANPSRSQSEWSTWRTLAGVAGSITDDLQALADTRQEIAS